MKELITAMSIMTGNESDSIKLAMGQNQYTGNVIKDFFKIIRNEESTN